MLFIGGRALRARGLELAGKIAAKTGCKVQGAGGTARIERGAGRIPVLRLHFVIENAQAQLKGTQQMVLCGAKAPFAFFAYPGKPSVLSPDDCEISTLCPVEGDPIGSLEALAMELMPRITRAQVMDVLSSQANLAGYQAVIDAASVYDRAIPMMMTLGQHSQDPHASFYHFTPGGFAFETITELEPWHDDGFELNPEKLSTWGHEVVGPILGPSVRTPEELLEPELLAKYKRS